MAVGRVMLKVIDSTLPAPPYPGDIRAKGFTFQIDWELIRQSKTWICCPADVRPWLLMLWAHSWTNAPAGTYEDDDELIAASIGMDARVFKANREHLMRGWSLCSDGRLYHATITQLVLEMSERREKDRARVAAWRERQKATGESDGVTRDKPVRSRENDTGTGVDSNGSISTKAEPKGSSLVVAGQTGDPEAGKGEEQQSNAITRKVAKSCPHQLIVRAYHEILPELNAVSTWDERRQGYSRQRWREAATEHGWQDQESGLRYFSKFFRYVRTCPHLMGKSKPRDPDGPPFMADLEWLLRPTNFRKVIEGKYQP